jgi:hypothetical protein
MDRGKNVSDALAVLQDAVERIRRIEAEARESLYIRDDLAAHRRKLLEKTLLLMELPDLAEPFFEGMEKSIRAEIHAGLKLFARRASQALELSSIFYMSALLYPEDYREGDRNDLELFVDRLRVKLLS